jgi:hypothetical protein
MHRYSPLPRHRDLAWPADRTHNNNEGDSPMFYQRRSPSEPTLPS